MVKREKMRSCTSSSPVVGEDSRAQQAGQRGWEKPWELDGETEMVFAEGPLFYCGGWLWRATSGVAAKTLATLLLRKLVAR